MKKLVLSLAAVCGLSVATFAQACTPDPRFTNAPAGVYPLPDQTNPIDTFFCVEQGGSATLTAVVPDSLTSPARLDLTSIRISGLTGLPAGMSFANNVTFYSPNPRDANQSTTDATFADRSIGCALISVPSATTIGDYGFTITAVVNGFLPVTFGNGSLVPGRYTLRVVAPGGCAVGLESVGQGNFVGMTVQPNPTVGVATIKVASSKATQATMNIVNMMGQVINTQLVNLNEGEVMVDFDASSLSAGIYMVNMQTEDGRISRRFVKQ